MGKIRLIAQIKSENDNLNINTTGIKSKNKITYKENDITVTILLFDNRIEMNRNCKEYNITLEFEKNKKTISKYQVFGGSKIFDLETNTKVLKINNNSIRIDYELEGTDFKYTLEMEDL